MFHLHKPGEAKLSTLGMGTAVRVGRGSARDPKPCAGLGAHPGMAGGWGKEQGHPQGVPAAPGLAGPGSFSFPR